MSNEKIPTPQEFADGLYRQFQKMVKGLRLKPGAAFQLSLQVLEHKGWWSSVDIKLPDTADLAQQWIEAMCEPRSSGQLPDSCVTQPVPSIE